MKTVTKTALANLRQNKSRNLLIGIAVCLTTLLLFLIPGIGLGMLRADYQAVNQIYPLYHGVYYSIDEHTADSLLAVEGIKEAGFRCDAARIVSEEYSIPMIYMDQTAMDLNRIEIEQGRLPQEENEIAVFSGFLKAMGHSCRIGDQIRLSYQPEEADGLGYQKEQEFTICGLLKNTQAQDASQVNAAVVSKAFVEQEIPQEERRYEAYFCLKEENRPGLAAGQTTDQMKEKMQTIASGLGIGETQIGENGEYLAANYTDPSTISILVLIMLVVVTAGIVTIYSIYYVSMMHRVQEYGKLKALGASRRQIRQMVFREGLAVAAAAIPAGLLLGTVILLRIFPLIYGFIEVDETEVFVTTVRSLLVEGDVPLLDPALYLLAAAAALLTICCSLAKPMGIAARISPVEALRYQGEGKTGKGQRKGYNSMSLWRLTKSNLARNKKRTAVTILAMAFTGSFFLAVATVLSCANPRESANASIDGQYTLSVITESGNREHPELEWSQVRKNNPMTRDFIGQIQELDGVRKVEAFQEMDVTGSFCEEGEMYSLMGYPQSYQKILEQGILEGDLTYEEMEQSNQVILSKNAWYWGIDLQVGDSFTVNYQDGNERKEAVLQVGAVGSYTVGVNGYAVFLGASSLFERLSDDNSTAELRIFADQDYDPVLERALMDVCGQSGKVRLSDTWQKNYEIWSQGMALIRMGCCLFLGVLGVICIMNLINTMLNSIHVRKKELGMLQAIGMSQRQLIRMLELEGLFYTIGTLLCSLLLGSLLGYGFYWYARDSSMFNITAFHYPLPAAVGLAVILLLLQLTLVAVIGKSMKRQSLIERIRFSE